MQTTHTIPQGYKSSPLGPIPQDWEVSELNEIVNFISSGKSKTDNEGGEYPIFGSTGIIGYNSKTDYSGKNILVARVGANAGTVNIVDGEYSVSDNTLIVNLKGICNFNYIYFFLINCDLNKIVFGSGQPLVTGGQLKLLKIPLPPLPEQTTIATILSTVDTTIQQTQGIIKKLELRNKGLAQNLLSGKIRVKGFTDKRNSIEFQDIYSQFKEKASNENYEILSVTKEKIVSQSEYFNKEIASEDTSGYLIVKKGDFVMSGLNFWMGSAHVVENFDIGMVSPAYKTFRIHNKDISKGFMRFFVESSIMRRALVGSSVQGASIVRRNLDQEMLESWIFKIPSLQEQEMIANMLDKANQQLNKYKQKLIKLQLLKKGLMQQLLTGKVRVKVK